METALHDWRPFHDQCSRQCLCFASQTSIVLLLMISRHAQLLELIIVDLAREEIDWVWFLLLPSAWNSHGFCIGDCFTSTFQIDQSQLFSQGLELSKTTWIAWLGFNDNAFHCGAIILCRNSLYLLLSHMQPVVSNIVWWFLAYCMEGKIYSLTKHSKALKFIDEATTKICKM